VIVVERLLGLATIQDRGRPGRMHEGLAPGGALVPELLALANRRAGNPDDAPAIEVLGAITIQAERELVVGTTATVTLRAGEQLVIESEPRRVAYVALAGGIEAPLVLGGRGTQLSAGIGVAIRKGDRFAPARKRDRFAGPAPDPTLDGSISIVTGPDVVPGALEALLADSFRISPASDRVGTRLHGPRLPAPPATGGSRPLVIGAIELPPDGVPIVLGPEHPTTGGYPVIAVVASRHLGRFHACRIGGTVRFTSDVVR
jgi:5-oxoprolinase (ATP-hydrolysing) subunit C